MLKAIAAAGVVAATSIGIPPQAAMADAPIKERSHFFDVLLRSDCVPHVEDPSLCTLTGVRILSTSNDDEVVGLSRETFRVGDPFRVVSSEFGSTAVDFPSMRGKSVDVDLGPMQVSLTMRVCDLNGCQVVNSRDLTIALHITALAPPSTERSKDVATWNTCTADVKRTETRVSLTATLELDGAQLPLSGSGFEGDVRSKTRCE